MLGLVFSVIVLAGCSNTVISADKDPYTPDCGIIRAWLKDKYGEVEIVSWGKRVINRNPELGDHVTLTVRFKKTGQSQVKSGRFIIGAFDVVESANIAD